MNKQQLPLFAALNHFTCGLAGQCPHTLLKKATVYAGNDWEM